MKNNELKNKNILWWVIGLLVLILAIVLIYKGMNGKSLKIWNDTDDKLVDIANSKDYSKYENKISSVFEGTHNLAFSFLHKNDTKVVQGTGAQAKWFKLLNASSSNDVTLYFTYEGGRGYSADDYVNEVLKTNKDIKVDDVKFADDASSTIKHVLDESSNAEYYVQSVKGADGSAWLAIVENVKANDDLAKAAAKDMMRSLEVK